MSQVEINQEAPDFVLDDMYGNPFKLSEYRGLNNVLLALNRGFF